MIPAAKRLLTKGTFTTWGAFASTKWFAEQEVTEYLSLEYIHNNVHVCAHLDAMVYVRWNTRLRHARIFTLTISYTKKLYTKVKKVYN